MARQDREMEFRRGLSDEDKRRIIVAAGREVFAQQGYNDTAVEDILKKAEISRGTFYRYFRNKRQVFDLMIDGLFDEIMGQWGREPIPAPQSPAEALKRIEDFIRTLFNRLLRDRETADLVWNEARGVDADMDAKLRSLDRRLAAVCESDIKHGIKLGVVRPMNPRVVSYGVVGMIRELVDQALHEGELPPTDALIEDALFFYLFGVAAPELLPGAGKHH